MCSLETSVYTAEERKALLDLARASIHHGLNTGKALEVEPGDYPAHLREDRACFVSLHRDGALRGCIGHLEAMQPLVSDVADNAFSAAFQDPRFPPLASREEAGLKVHISILSPAVPIDFHSETDLLEQIRPGVDGLILQDGPYRGTFLPSVWESLPTVEAFWRHLKAKAGLPENHWSDSLEVSRYETESFSA